MNFVHLINNYRSLYRLGIKIINHKHLIKYVDETKINLEHAKQEERIEKFERMIKKNHRDWKLNKNCINQYWTGK